MAKTNALIELETRINVLEGALVPTVNSLGIYTNAELDLIRAYVLLCHAEIETFIEDWAKILLQTLTAELQNLKSGSKFARLHANRVARDLLHTINTNHGIKAKNLLNMFGPFGILETDFDAIDANFLSLLNGFGHRRGESAHGSVMRATKQPNPIQEKKTVYEILSHLEKFEEVLIRIRLSGILK